jgi:hypothetical protein
MTKEGRSRLFKSGIIQDVMTSHTIIDVFEVHLKGYSTAVLYCISQKTGFSI